ncbi:hypothetical protein PP175_25390 (plasmid) [Aneurinibacillus sp. Ricciae_BoGa-3]|uniref:hypothetical protein n=1 Tax=Aneurinibacillus sp. Ricciae_BoGa-3 TaxID=3022697 RepID=UPI002341EB26|nr:hypothetical protein [Aneurinibacillus sp. Ricciae_BoGa-3]WCK57404.1 hypothetical protein PP175_25390 [Aneurinibacillus sp. Ricciae_BoGa-3]
MAKDKTLKEFKTESNGEEISVRVIETDKGIQIFVDGQTPDVFVNGEVLYSKYDKEEYKLIPPTLRSFVEERFMSYSEIIKEKGTVIARDLSFFGLDYDIEFSSNRAKEKNVRITNWLNDYEKINDYLVEPIADGKENFKKLVSSIKEYGYDFRFAYGGNEYDNIYALVVPISEFDEEKINNCIKLWQSYDEQLEKYTK